MRADTVRRHRALLSAATQVFLEHGFERATLGDVIAKAGGSRKTIYDHFGDKAGLFRAVINNMSLDRIDSLEPLLHGNTPQEVLRHYAAVFMKTLLTREMVALYRIVIAEAPRFPEVSRSIFEMASEPAAAKLAAYLKREARLGNLCIADAGHAARAFSVMIFANLHIRCLLDPGHAPGRAEIRSLARLGTDLFLKGAAPRSASAR